MLNIELIKKIKLIYLIVKNLPYSGFSVPYVTIFLKNLLYLLLNRCDLKLKPVFICFYFTGFWFHAFARTFPCCCCSFSLVIDIKSTKKMVKASLSRVAIKRICFHITLNQMSVNENLLWPMDYTALNIYSRVCVMKVS